MTVSQAAPLTGGVALLERAVGYLLGCLQDVTPDALTRPTPCRGWDVSALLAHLNESLAELEEAVEAGLASGGGAPSVAGGPAGLAWPAGGPVNDLVAPLRGRATRLLGASAGLAEDVVFIGGCPVSTAVVASVGAIEVAVHGWDLSRACGTGRPIPAGLADEMLGLARLFVTGEDRPTRFAPAVPVPGRAAPGDRLVAFLGRAPR